MARREIATRVARCSIWWATRQSCRYPAELSGWLNALVLTEFNGLVIPAGQAP